MFVWAPSSKLKQCCRSHWPSFQRYVLEICESKIPHTHWALQRKIFKCSLFSVSPRGSHGLHLNRNSFGNIFLLRSVLVGHFFIYMTASACLSPQEFMFLNHVNPLFQLLSSFSVVPCSPFFPTVVLFDRTFFSALPPLNCISSVGLYLLFLKESLSKTFITTDELESVRKSSFILVFVEH